MGCGAYAVWLGGVALTTAVIGAVNCDAPRA